MKTELVLMGMHLDVTLQTRHRRLVSMVYTGIAALIAGFWFIDRWRLTSVILMYVPILVNWLILGGYYSDANGIVKLFLSNDVRSRYLKNPLSAWSRLTEKTLPNVTDERLFSNDERELRRRDAAHWISYRYLGMGVIAAFFVAYLKNLLSNAWDSLHVPPAIFDTLIYGLLMAAFVLFFTLPQSILLWTEPDIEAEG